MNYRNLTSDEILTLSNQGCSASNWQKVKVKDGFTTKYISNVDFAGEVKLGIFNQDIEIEKGITRHSGLFNTYIQDCTIGDNVYISNVGNLLNYDVESDVIIDHVNTLIVNEETTFGNGIEIAVLNEAGGRELPIFDKLSAQIAYLLVMYRHDTVLIKKLKKIIENYTLSTKSNRGHIGIGAKIINTHALRNVIIGNYAMVLGSQCLLNGTVVSSKESRTFIGAGVIANDFIILEGSSVNEFSVLQKTFVGEGVRIGKQFSSENSAFFANCEMFHGEVRSTFAGPYAVSQHKSTLLIAAMVSFFNAGSATNQSNHMYKLGALHQGILERGVKTGSSSYLLFPTHVGAFTTVIGRHSTNFDTSCFPFSYIKEDDGKSILMPAVNLCKVGTLRDSRKWIERDRRKGSKLDLIHFELYNPFLIRKILKGIEVAQVLDEKASEEQKTVRYNGITIPRSLLKNAIKIYELAINTYIGNEVVKRLTNLSNLVKFHEVRECLKSSIPDVCEVWADIFGMFLPICAVDNLSEAISVGEIDTIEKLQSKLEYYYDSYDDFSWSWCINLMQNKLGISIEEINPSQLIKIIELWKDSLLKINAMIVKDAESEFGQVSKIGYGIDGDASVVERDFIAVRGGLEDNKFIIGLRKESENLEKQATEIIACLNKL